MAEKINFQLEFENNQRSLRSVRQEVERSLRNLNVDFVARVTDIAAGRGAGGNRRQQRQQQGAQSEVSRADRDIQRATADFISALRSRADAEEQITAIVESTTRFTREDNQALQRLSLVRASAERRIKEVTDSEARLIPVIRNLEQSFEQAGREVLEGSRRSASTLEDGVGQNVRSLRDVIRRNRLQAESQSRLSRITEAAARVFQFTQGAIEQVGRDVTAFTRPVQTLTARADTLALQFSSTGDNLRRIIGRLSGRDIGVDEFRAAVAEASGDLVGTISRLTGVPDELIKSSGLFDETISRFSAELADARTAENQLIRSTRDLAASRRRLSQERQTNLRRVFNEVSREQEAQAGIESRISEARRKVLSEQERLAEFLEQTFAQELRQARERQRGQQRRTTITPEDLQRSQIVQEATAVVDNLRNASDAIRRARTERIPRRIDEIGRAALGLRNTFESNQRALTESARRISQIDEQLPEADDSQSRRLQEERAQLERRRLELIRENNNILLREQQGAAETIRLQQNQVALEEEQRRIEQQIVRAQRDELNARTEVARRERQRARGGGAGGAGNLRINTPQQIEAFSRNLDTRGLERLVGILRNTETGLRRANVQLKANQGNIARSSALTEELTRDLDSGQRAAFQFGFAAANAAERLAAWASPAAFIFQALNLLRQSVDQIVRIDSEFRRIAFFDRTFLDNIADSITRLGEATLDVTRGATDTEGAFGRLATQQQRIAALAANQEEAFQRLSQRALETGLAFDQVAELALTAARVGESAFQIDEESGQVVLGNFFRAAEAAVRLEGDAANATQIVGQLNSVLNQFGQEGEEALGVVALIAEAVGESAFSFQQLLDVLARTGGSFRALQGAGAAESIEAIRFFSERANVSIGQVSTSIRQLSTGVVRAREEFGLFANVAEIDREGITSFDGLLSVLEQIQEFQGQPELEQFLSLFSERRIQTNIINFSENVDELRNNLEELEDPARRAEITTAAIANLLAETAFQADSAQANINRFNTQLTLFGEAARFDDVQSQLAQFGTQILSVATSLTEAIGGIAPVFAALAGAAAPVLRQIVLGFRAGLIASQNQQIVIGQITQALGQERNAIKAVNLAERERLINAQTANSLRARGISIVSQQVPLENTLKQLVAERNILEKQGELGAARLQQVKTRINALEQQRVTLLGEQAALENQINATISTQATQLQGSLRRRLPAIIGGAALVGGTFAADAIGGAFEDRSFGDQVSGALQSAIAGGVTGFAVGGPIGAALGAGVGVIGSIVSARQESARLAEQEAEAQRLANEGAAQQLRVLNEQFRQRSDQLEKASDTEREIINLQQQQQLIQVEIQRIGQEKAQQQGLLTRLTDLEVRLAQARTRLGREEEAQLQNKLNFEREIVATRERQQIIEQTITAIRDAQIALLEREGDLETTAKVRFEFDELNLASQRQSLEDELSNVAIRIQQISALGGAQNEQELRALNRDRERLANRINKLEIQTLQTRFRNQLAILDASEKQTRDSIQRFRQAGDAVSKALADAIKLQGGIADAIRRQGEFVNDILEVQLERAEAALSTTNVGLSEQQRIERTIALQRAFLQQQLANVNRIFQRQRETLQQTASLEEIEEQVDAVISSLGDLEEAQGNAAKSDDIRLQEREAIFNREQALLQNRLAAIQNEINIRQQDAQARIDLARQQIEVEESAIEALRKRAELEEETADRLLDAPEELLTAIRSTLTARNFIQAVRGRSERQDSELRGLLRRQQRGEQIDPARLQQVREQAFVRSLRDVIQRGGIGNRAVLQQVRDGLQELANQGVSALEGFSPEELVSVFRRSILGEADTVNKQLSEQEQTNQKIDSLLGLIGQQLGEQGRLAEIERELLAQQQRVADEQKRLNEEQVSELRQQVATSIANSNRLAEEVKASADNIVGLRDQLTSLIENTEGVSQGEQEIKGSVDVVARILEDIALADPQVNEIRRLGQEFDSLLRGGTNVGNIGDADAETLGDKIGAILVDALARGQVGQFDRLQDGESVAGISRELLENTIGNLGVSVDSFITALDNLDENQIRTAIGESVAAGESRSADPRLVDLGDVGFRLIDEFLESLRQARLEELREVLGDRASEVEQQVLEDQRASEAQRRIADEQRAATVEAIRDNVRTRAQLESLITVLQQSVQQGASNLQNTEAIITAVNRVAEQRSQQLTETGTIPPVAEFDADSLAALKTTIDLAFGEAIEGFRIATNQALQTPLSIDFGEVVVNLNAQILQNIQGEEFAAQITTALIGTGLEDRVGLIQEILSSLVQTELERGNTDLPAGALEGIGNGEQ